tara:strand:+ start:115 stop:363 length:249 start_codon:yes stop_codon:yes gene_type:complete
MLERIIDIYENTELTKLDGFNKAIIGVSEDFNQPIRLIYSVSKCLNILMVDMDEDEALEYFYFNVSNAYIDKKTPVLCWDNF